MIPLRVGDQIEERSYQNDQTEWKLPEKRLERFRKNGVIIKEEQHITGVAHVTVVSVERSGAMLHVHVRITSLDVPRHKVTMAEQSAMVPFPLSSDRLSVAEAATAAMPITFVTPARLGQRWRTRRTVVTTLRSGTVTFDHLVRGFENGLVEIAIHGRGEITGMEYHLPFLLPGSIELTGTAWYEVSTGLVTQESYLIHNQLIKPAEGEHIGFDERLTVDTTTRLVPRNVSGSH
jgi:hypothetical protein